MGSGAKKTSSISEVGEIKQLHAKIKINSSFQCHAQKSIKIV